MIWSYVIAVVFALSAYRGYVLYVNRNDVAKEAFFTFMSNPKIEGDPSKAATFALQYVTFILRVYGVVCIFALVLLLIAVQRGW